MKAPTAHRGILFRKYALYLVGAVCTALLASGASGIYFSQSELHSQLNALQRDNAVSAAEKIGQFVAGIEQQIEWIAGLPPDDNVQDLRLEAQRLLRQAPAISDVTLIDAAGKEKLFVSRFELDRINDGRDLSGSDAFKAAMQGQPHFGAIYFRLQTEPYMTIALPRSGPGRGAVLADVNLKAVWDVISQIKVGRSGYSFVVDGDGVLIAHPDLNLVLSKMNMAKLPQVAAALAALRRHQPAAAENGASGVNVTGARVLSTYVAIPSLRWTVFVEQPLVEADAPIYAAILRNIALLLGGLVLAFAVSLMLAKRMVTPVAALRRGAEQLASGNLDYRVDIRTGDELESVAHQFNAMAARLQESYVDLERKIEERTRELKIANEAKTRFLAAASHDLRQPMHALGMFISSLRGKADPAEITATLERAGTAVDIMADLLDGLLDLSRLDAGVVQPAVQDFPLHTILDRIAFDFQPEARDKGLQLRIVRSAAVVRSDPTMLSRILLNLVSNAIRFTAHGKVLVGCRRHGNEIRIEVHDTGIGIAPEQRTAIFQEFFKVADTQRDDSHGLGLGLSIVKRLADLLGCPIDVSSTVGKGSTFSIRVPRGTAQTLPVAHDPPVVQAAGILAGRRVLVIDDDMLVLDGMRSILGAWACQVITAQTGEEATCLVRLQDPDVVICDFTLHDGETGIDLLHRLIAQAPHPMAVMLMTGDVGAELLRLAKSAGYTTLHKPVRPAALRSVMTQLLADLDATSGEARNPRAGGISAPPAI
jgi:signal transduction histidine kinase/ActR/RegA family two-component response regulator